MLCILYVTLVGALLGVAGLSIERALPPEAPRRWLWFIIIPISIFLPGFYRSHHNLPITEVLGQPSAHAPLGAALGTTRFGPLDPSWWTHIESYDTAINRLWLSASALLILWGLVNALRVSRLIRLSRRAGAESPGTATVDGVPVVVTDFAGPATVGFWRSRVLVPRWVLTLPEPQRQYVVRHEEEHRRAHDAQLLFIASLALILMPWNLALWWLLRRLCLAVEMDCDNRVVNGLGDPTAYGELLLKIALIGSRGPRLQPAFLGVGALERRLTMLLAPTPLRHVQRFLLPALALGLVVVVLLTPHPITAADHTHSTGIEQIKGSAHSLNAPAQE